MQTRDEMVGAAVREARGDRTQVEVAEAMVERGHTKWSQSTVWAVEKGTRPLRLVEADSLVTILDVKFYALMGKPGDLTIWRKADDVSRAQMRLVGDMVRVMRMQNILHDHMTAEGKTLEDAFLSKMDYRMAKMDPRETIAAFLGDDENARPHYATNPYWQDEYERWQENFGEEGAE